MLEAARSQIAGTVSQTEVRNLPLNGRNFLDLALLVPGVSPTNVGGTQLFAETSAVAGSGISVGSQRNFSNNFIVDGLSANDDAAGLSGIPYGVDAVDQFQVVTSGGQAELGRALGGYVNVVTKSGTNAAHGDLYGYVRDDRFNARQIRRILRHEAADDPEAVRREPGRPDRPRPDVLLLELRAAQAGPVRSRDDLGRPTSARSTPGWRRSAIRARRSPRASIRTRCTRTNLLGKVDHQFNGRDQFSVRYSLYDVNVQQLPRRRRAERAERLGGAGQHRSGVAFSNTMTLSPRTVNETRAQFAYGDLKALPTDPIGPAVSIAGVASFGTLSGSPQRRVNKMYQVVDNLSHQAGAHALRVGADFLYNDDTITYPRSIRGSYAFSSLANFLAGVYNNAGFTQTFGTTVVSQTNPNVGVYAQDEWKVSSAADAERRAALRPAVPRDDRHRHEQRLAAPRVRVVAVRLAAHGGARQRRALLRSRAASRRSRTRCCRPGTRPTSASLRQTSVSLSPTQAGAPVFPNILSAVVPSVTLVNLTTMDRDMQNAYSRQASVEVEQQLGERSTVSVGYQYLRGAEPDHVGESERADVRGGGHQQRMPPEPELREQQPVFVRGGLQLSRPARVVRAAAGAVGQLPRQLHALEVDEQRRRELLQLADRSVRPLEGLGPIRRRPAASSRRQRLRQFVDGAGAHRLGAAQPRLSVEQHAAVRTRRCRSTSRPA